MKWNRRHVLDTDDWSRDEIEAVLDQTRAMIEILQRPIRRAPPLRGRTVILFFAESSTRTRVSFELAAKALSADVTNITASGSSVEKGESLYDTVFGTTVAAWIKVNAWTTADQAIVTKGDTASVRLQRDASNNGVAFVCPAGPQPGFKNRGPPFIIRAGGQLGHVVTRTVSFYSGKFAKIVDRMAAIGRAAADADQEQPPPAVPQSVELGRQSLDRGERNIMTNLRGRSKEGFRVVHRPTALAPDEIAANSCHIRPAI